MVKIDFITLRWLHDLRLEVVPACTVNTPLLYCGQEARLAFSAVLRYILHLNHKLRETRLPFSLQNTFLAL